MVQRDSSESGSSASTLSPGSIRIFYRSQRSPAESLASDPLLAHGGKRVPGKGKRVSDLPGGTVGVCFGTVTMRERRLTSLEGIRIYEKMHTLFLQDNCLLSLEHLGPQPDLTVLRLERNIIDDFHGAERCPKLKEVYLEGNPIEKKELCNVMACLAMNPGLIKVNGKVLTKQEKQLVVTLDRPVMRMALQQGWMLSASVNNGAEVDLPVEEFFFRLEPAVEQLLSQGVPAAYCNINVHHHLRRSYEMLASVRVQPVLALSQHQAASMSSKPLKSNRSSPPRYDTSDSSDRGFGGGGGKQPWRITQLNTYNRSATANNQPRSKWAKVELEKLDSLSTPNELGHSGSNQSHATDDSIDYSPRGDINKANTSTGHREEKVAATDDNGSPEVLTWKLSSLDFDSPRRLLSSIGAKSQETPVTPETENGRRAPKGHEFATMFPGNGFTRSPDLANSPQLSPVKDFQRKSNSVSPKKIPRSPNSSINSSPAKSTLSPQKSFNKSFAERWEEREEKRGLAAVNHFKKPSPAREVLKKSPSRLSKVSSGGWGKANQSGDGQKRGFCGGGSGAGVVCDDDDMTAMLSDIRKASSAYADLESWVGNESLLGETAAPLSQLLSGFGGSPTDKRKRSTFSKDKNEERSNTRDKQAQMEDRGAKDTSFVSRGSVREAWQPNSSLDDRVPFSINFSYTPPKNSTTKNYPFGVKEVKERKRPGAEGLGSEWDSSMKAVGHPGSLHRLGRTMYGKLLLEECRAYLRDWLFISVGRQRLRLASKFQREGETELQVREVLGYKGGTGRMYHDVSIGRLKDEAFRIWLFNAAWLLCKKEYREPGIMPTFYRGMGNRIRWRLFRTCLCKWKLFVGVLAERHKCFSSVDSQRIAMMQRALSWHKDVICHGGGGSVCLSQKPGARAHQIAMEVALSLFRRSRAAYAVENMPGSVKDLDRRLQLYISFNRAQLTNSFRVWRNFARDIKLQALTERVHEVEAKLCGYLEASLLARGSPERAAGGGRQEEAQQEHESEITSQPSRSPSMSSIYWDKNAVATLVDAKFSQTSYADNSELKDAIVDLLLAVARDGQES